MPGRVLKAGVGVAAAALALASLPAQAGDHARSRPKGPTKIIGDRSPVAARNDPGGHKVASKIIGNGKRLVTAK